ncbi:MAG: hypothetical protein HY832_04070 [Candidatus Aenigmarchaeota archaeon]|nr:hypothetical protein [Candidatus Aenigmarchaeota archaeon]
MGYTFVPKQKTAKAMNLNAPVSPKAAMVLCRAIRKKTLTRGKRLLIDLIAENRSLDGKYYTKAAEEMLRLLESCEKNAEFLGLDKGKLFIHGSATRGVHMRRRRRKSGFGSIMKSAHIEFMLIERGKESKTKPEKKKIEETETKKIKEHIHTLKEKSHDLEKKVHEEKEMV